MRKNKSKKYREKVYDPLFFYNIIEVLYYLKGELITQVPPTKDKNETTNI